MSIITREGEHDTVGRIIPHFSAECESVSALLDAEPVHAANLQRGLGRGQLSRGWFDLPFRSGTEALDGLINVDPGFYDCIASKLAKLTPPAYEQAVFRQHKRKRKRVKRDHGNSLDIHEVMQGRVDRAWDGLKFETREVQANKNIHLIINCSLNAGITADMAQWRSAAAIAIHDELVRQGKSVAVYMVRTSQNMFEGYSGINTLMVPIKRLGQYMSVEHMAAWTSATFTRVVMMYKYSNSIPGRKPTMGYGFAQNWEVLPHTLRKLRDSGQACVYVPHCYTEFEAKAAIERVITQLQGGKK